MTVPPLKPSTSLTATKPTLDDLFQELECTTHGQRRSYLLQEINQTRPKIAVLPLEIVAIIFETLCNPVDLRTKWGLRSVQDYRRQASNPKLPQLTLGAVCLQWRRIVLSTPQLWTYLHIMRFQQNLNACSHFFTYSSPLPMSLDIEQDLIDSVLGPLLTENASRIRELSVFELTPAWKESISRMPNLLRLMVSRETITLERESLSIQSPLQYLKLGRTFQIPSFSRSSVTVIHLRHSDVNIVLGLLMRFTHLLEFRFRGLGDTPVSKAIELPRQPITFPRLTLFEWMPYRHGQAIDESMTSFCRMPALKHLIWGEGSGEGVPPGRARRDFLQRLRSLESLDITNVNSFSWTDEALEDLFSHIPEDTGITHLILCNLPATSLSIALRKLTPVEGLPTKLPKLKTLTISGSHPDNHIRELTLSMFEARLIRQSSLQACGRPGEGMVLTFQGSTLPDSELEDHQREKLKKLENLGVQVLYRAAWWQRNAPHVHAA